MMEKLTVKAGCKINLSLEICGCREDGYHILRSVIQTLDTGDILTISGSDVLEVICSESSVPSGKDNTAYKAAAVFERAFGIKSRVRIYIDKIIPDKAGFGGGSADAAAVLLALRTLYGIPETKNELLDIAPLIGADVAACLAGGTLLAEGTGEKITKLRPLENCSFLLAMPGEKNDTGKAYRVYDMTENPVQPDTGAVLDAVEKGDIRKLAVCRANVFEQCCMPDSSQGLVLQMKKLGAFGAGMTGSGTAVFGIFPDGLAAAKARQELRGHVWSAVAGPSEGMTVERS